MKKYSLIFFLFIVVPFSFSNAQAKMKANPAVKFTTIVQAGILEGEANKTFGQFQLVNGIQYNAWFYGLGLGVDYYGDKRSVPLFLDIKGDLKKGKKTPFVYADAGYNFSWLREGDKMNFWGTDYKTRGGLFYETGLGYKFILKNKMALGLSAGYSFKQQKEMFKQNVFMDFPPYNQPGYIQPYDIYDNQFRRVSLKFNCSF